MRERQAIESVDQLRVLAHPVRLRVLRLFAGGGSPLSVKQMADRLGEPHSKVHYHVMRLVKGGFLKQVGEHLVNGIVERFYQASARGFMAGPDLRGLPGYEAVSQLVHESMFAAVREVYEEAAREGRCIQAQFQEGYLTLDELEELTDRIAREMEARAVARPGAAHVRWVAIATRAREAGGE